MKYEYSPMGTPIYTASMAGRDGRNAVKGYRLRKHKAREAKLIKSGQSKAKAISLMAATAIIPLATQLMPKNDCAIHIGLIAIGLLLVIHAFIL